MTDIVERLRALDEAAFYESPATTHKAVTDAADEIVRLRSEVTTLRLHLTAADCLDGRLRSELEQVKRDAVEALKPFADRVSNDKDAPSHFIWADDPDHWDAYSQNWGKHIKVAHCRAARAFVEKHGRDG